MIINNKCKNCGGELIYDADSNELKCKWCHCIVNIPDQKTLNTKKPWTSGSTIKTSKTEYTQYSCSVCGRKHISPTNTSLTTCPSCGAGDLKKNLEIEYIPDGIVPFKLNKQKALECFNQWLKTQRFAPSNLKKLAKSQEISGLYLPAFNYDFNCITKYSGIGINTHTDSQGRIHTSKHQFNDERKDCYNDYLKSANSHIDCNTLRKIGNFDFENLCIYRTEFLYGWVALGIDTFLQDSCKDLKNEITCDIKNRVRFSLPYQRIENFVCTTNFFNLAYNYLYLPVWHNSYRYKNKNYSCYINGVNGRVCGKAPKSFWKIFFTVLGICAFIGGIVYLCTKYVA